MKRYFSLLLFVVLVLTTMSGCAANSIALMGDKIPNAADIPATKEKQELLYKKGSACQKIVAFANNTSFL